MNTTDIDFRFALFSDVHANLPALEAVLQDIDRHNINQIWCLGDVVDFAPWPNEVIALLRRRAIPVVMGNHDRRVAMDEPVTPLAKHSAQEQQAREQAIALSKRTLTEDNRRWLSALPRSIAFNAGPLRVLLVHASPDSLSEYVHRQFSCSQLMKWQTAHQFDVMVSGHTHYADIRELVRSDGRRLTVANTGAVGRIKAGEPQATWLMGHYRHGKLKLAVQTVNYDVAVVAQAIKDSQIPDFYADELYQHGMYCSQALSAF